MPPAAPSWRAIAIAFAAAFVAYAAAACPVPHSGDSAELIAAAWGFGVPHPPGYPTFTLVTGVALRVVPGDPGWAANLVAAAYAAGAVASFLCLLARWGVARWAATVGALSLAGGVTLVSQAVALEVYGFDLLLLSGALHAATTVGRLAGPDAPGARRALATFGCVVGLWIGHRFVNVVYLPAVCALAGGPRAVSGARGVAALAGGLALGLAPILYLPLAAAAEPAIDIGDPSTLERLWVVVSGAPYRRHLLAGGGELAVGRLVRLLSSLPEELGVGAVLAIGGVSAGLGRPPASVERREATVIVALAGGTVVVVGAYAVLDVAVFALPGLAALALAAARGAERAAALAGDERRAAAVRSTLLGLALACGASGWRESSLADVRAARAVALETLASAPDGAAVFVEGDTTLHQLWYAQAVDGARPDVVVVSPGHFDFWYLEQLHRRHPELPLPPYQVGDPALGRRVVEALLPLRRVFLTSSVDSAALLGGGPYALVPAGLLSEVLAKGAVIDPRARGRDAARVLRRAVAALGRPPGPRDMDGKSAVLGVALPLLRVAELLEQSGELDEAAALLTLLLGLEPERHEHDLAEDVRQGLGQRIPRLGLEGKARASLDRVAARRAAPPPPAAGPPGTTGPPATASPPLPPPPPPR